MKVLGIDPGSHRIGYGIVSDNGSLEMIDCGLLEYKGKGRSLLADIYQDVSGLISKNEPDFFAIEKLFFFKNQKTHIAVAQSRGVLLLAALHNKIPVIEMTPLQVKQSTTGYGSANKKAVAEMVVRLLKLESSPKPDDVTDALAVALTGAQMARRPHLLS